MHQLEAPIPEDNSYREDESYRPGDSQASQCMENDLDDLDRPEPWEDNWEENSDEGFDFAEYERDN